MKDAPQVCEVHRTSGPCPDWTRIPAQRLRHHMGPRPAHVPRAEFRIAYDAEALWLRWEVADRYVRAVAKRPQDPVCRDSCVEFFYTPGPDVAVGYCNLEINCGGTVLFHAHPPEGHEGRPCSAAALDRFEIAPSLPRIIDPEMEGPVDWTLECRLPWDALDQLPHMERPAPGAVWRANFYKCADATSHPHWLTWAPVDYPTPRFHLPRHFGVLKFQ